MPMLVKIYDFLLALLILVGLSTIGYIFVNRESLFKNFASVNKKDSIKVEDLHPVKLKISSNWLESSKYIRDKNFFSFKESSPLVYASGLNDPKKILLIGDYIVVSEADTGNIIVLRDTNKDNSADEKFIFDSGLRLPFGLSFYNGNLYVSTEGSVLVYEDFLKQLHTDTPKATVLISNLPTGSIGKLRPLLVGPDKKIYVGIGASCNSCIEEDRRRASVVTYNLDGSNEEVYSSGFKQLTDLIFYRGFIYATEESAHSNKTKIPHELNILKKSSFYGWPFLYGNNVPVSDESLGPFNSSKAETPLLTFDASTKPLALSSVESDDLEGLLISLASEEESKIVYFDLKDTVKDLFLWRSGENTFNAKIEGITPYKSGILVTDSLNGVIYYLPF